MSNGSRPSARLRFVLALSLLGSACSSGGGGGGDGSSGVGGEFLELEGGGLAQVDPNRGGGATRLRLVEMSWGRLVDVYALDVRGEVEAEPVARNWVVDEEVQSDDLRYRLVENQVAGSARLVILRLRDDPEFRRLLAAASERLPPVLPRHDDGSSANPFSLVPRNACLVLRFDDCLDDSAEAEAMLGQVLGITTGYRPSLPFEARYLFDPNHGAVVDDTFHSTRVLVDLATSPSEAASSRSAPGVNAVGLPGSREGNPQPNVSLRIPTREHAASGQVRVLRGLSGAPLAERGQGPIDLTRETRPVVRAFRSGNDRDVNSGFLLDLNPPRLIGEWPVRVTAAREDPADPTARAFQVDLAFDTSCQASLEEGDVLTVGGVLLEVAEETGPPVLDELLGVRVRSLSADAPPVAALLGAAGLETGYRTSAGVPVGCWLSFTPRAAFPPVEGVTSGTQVLARFSEPMAPRSVTAFDSFLVLRGGANRSRPAAEEIVVGTVSASSGLRSFAFTPSLPLSHQEGVAERYTVLLGSVADLAGNPLAEELPPVEFTLRPDQEASVNAGIVMRFSELDEVRPIDPVVGVLDDVRGQVFYDLERGYLRPREVTFTSYAADRSNPVPATMIPFPRGIQTPLSPFGSRLMAIWRYVDFGWTVTDETKYDLDVYGLWWSPIGGRVTRDYFEDFEIRLAHSRFLPDEEVDGNKLPVHANSGLVGAPGRFDDNLLRDPNSPRKVVHERGLGYVVDPRDLSRTITGTPIAPFPMNRPRGEELVTFTWRDTAARAVGGPGGVGAPLDLEAGPPLNLVPQGAAGSFARPGQVPTAGLPLLMEFRCYPTAGGIGVNSLDISLAINSSARPNFRAFSTGGVNVNGDAVFVDPDRAVVPDGGYNPLSTPPGRRTAQNADNTFYIGQLDTVTRVSRAHTSWIDTQLASPRFLAPVVEPAPADQPPGTAVHVEARGATGFAAAQRLYQDAAAIDAYGDARNLAAPARPSPTLDVDWHRSAAWSADLSALDGARYLQLRFTFVNDVDSGREPLLDGLGLAFEE